MNYIKGSGYIPTYSDYKNLLTIQAHDGTKDEIAKTIQV